MIVFDEFHERNLQTDLGLALALDCMDSHRPDLRLLVIVRHTRCRPGGRADRAPVVTGSGRMHPVELRWSPMSRTGRLEQHIASVVRQAMAEPGDVLVFLPGMAEIERVARLLDGVDADVHVLHGSISNQAQDQALLPSERRKVVLSTDIAETSLTVEGVRIVVDSGSGPGTPVRPAHRHDQVAHGSHFQVIGRAASRACRAHRIPESPIGCGR